MIQNFVQVATDILTSPAGVFIAIGLFIGLGVMCWVERDTL